MLCVDTPRAHKSMQLLYVLLLHENGIVYQAYAWHVSANMTGLD